MWQCQIFHGKWVRGVSAGGRGQDNKGKNIIFAYKLFENRKFYIKDS